MTINNSSLGQQPLVAVVMACFNDEKYISEAIDSVLAQDYQNWQLIIVNDASTDYSLKIMDSYDDSRILVVSNERNMGLAKSLNVGVGKARDIGAVFIARLDSDDIAKPDRLTKQVSYMEKHPEISVLGSNIEMFNDGEKTAFYITKFKEDNNRLFAAIPFSSPLPHSTWMIRVDDFVNVEIYNGDFRSSQDYEFMLRLFQNGKKIACINDVLVRYRVRPGSISHRREKADLNTVKNQIKFVKLMKINCSIDEVRAVNICNKGEDHSLRNYVYFLRYCLKVILANFKQKRIDEQELFIVVLKQIYGATKACLGITK